jgi:Ca2+-binding EF-hand superfamily protein
LKGTGKADLLDFTDEQILKLKECFDDLDEDGSGEIGLEEMKGPLLGLGFAKTIEDVRKMIAHVDLDGSGEIEFPEFLAIIKNTGCDPLSSAAKMTQFFKDLTSGKMG